MTRMNDSISRDITGNLLVFERLLVTALKNMLMWKLIN